MIFYSRLLPQSSEKKRERENAEKSMKNIKIVKSPTNGFDRLDIDFVVER